MTRSPSSQSLRSAALDYTKRGWPVFPLRTGGKEPLTRRGFHDAVTDRDAALAFWSQYPTANIGLRTGIAFDVLDIDGPEGAESFLAYLEEQGAAGYRHAGPVSRTGRGFHLLFAKTGFRNGANLRPKIDFRGDGGYIVAPPSLHPLGHHYAWDEGRGPEAPLPEAPAWLIALLSKDIRAAEERTAIRAALAIAHEGFPQQISEAELTSRGKIYHGRPNILLVVSDAGLPIVRKGRYYWTTCPFHPDQNPSLALYTEDNTFHCYVCQAHGDSLDLRSQRDMNGRKFI